MTDRRPEFPRVPDGYDPILVDQFVSKILERARQEIQAATQRAERAVRELGSAVELTISQDANLASVAAEIESLKSAVDERDGRIAELAQAAGSVPPEVEEELAALRRETDDLRVQVAERIAESSALSAEIEDWRTRVAERDEQIARLEESASGASPEVEAELDELRAEVDDLRGQVADRDGRINALADVWAADPDDPDADETEEMAEPDPNLGLARPQLSLEERAKKAEEAIRGRFLSSTKN